MSHSWFTACLFALAIACLPCTASADHGPAQNGDEHAAAQPEAAEGEHGGHDAHGADGPGEINWMYGFLGEREGEEPSLLWRPVGMPSPVGAMFLNTGILFFVLYRMAKKPVAEGLKKRKQSILQGFAEAGQMRDVAAQRLAEYERKLGAIDDEIERVRVQMREGAALERKRVLQEAKERCERMERDARLLIEQELKAAREELIRETAKGALKSAEGLITAQLTGDDKQRLLQDYLATLGKNVSSGGKIGVNARGGQA